MKVTLVSGIAGGAFRDAEQLHRHGVLHRFITTRPDALRLGLPRSMVRLNIVPEVVARLPLKVPGLRGWYPGEYFKSLVFDRMASRLIGGEDIVLVFSGFGPRTLARARARGAMAVLERGSAHIVVQRRIVDEEFRRYDYRPRRLLDRRSVARQVREYAQADYIFVNSRFSERTFLEMGFPADRMLRAPQGVDLTRFRPLPKEDGVFRMVASGEGLRKGIQYLLEAARQLALPNSEVVWVGGMSPDVAPLLERYRGLYRYVGKIPNAEMERVYAQASVVVVPSVEEGWCFVVNEAMACGRPVISTDHTGASEIVRDGRDGFVVPIRDVQALKDKLVYLYQHESERAAMGRAALERVRDFTWDAYGDRMVAEMRRALAKGRIPE
jgi:glycosyltransferase involved in cell wall biosynthesis